jgi:hypothetical protein
MQACGLLSLVLRLPHNAMHVMLAFILLQEPFYVLDAILAHGLILSERHLPLSATHVMLVPGRHRLKLAFQPYV